MPLPPSIDSQQTLFILGGIVFVIVLIRLIFGREDPFPYDAAESILTPAERAFSSVLREAVGDDFSICPKIRLADVIVVRSRISSRHRMRSFSRICGKHLDFVLCDPESFQVLGVIELDDRSHRHRSRRERDAFVDSALAAAGIPILHMPAQRGYAARKLRSQVLEALEAGGSTTAERH